MGSESSFYRNNAENVKATKNNSDSGSDVSVEQKERVDMLIVCKIENEFGYPEEYILQCLKKAIKNIQCMGIGFLHGFKKLKRQLHAGR